MSVAVGGAGASDIAMRTLSPACAMIAPLTAPRSPRQYGDRGVAGPGPPGSALQPRSEIDMPEGDGRTRDLLVMAQDVRALD